MGCGCCGSVDGGGGGGRQDRREGNASHRDGKCDPMGGAGTASHRLSFLARGGRLATDVPKAFPEALPLFSGESQGLIPQIAAKVTSRCFGTFRNMLQCLGMAQVAPQRLTIRQIADRSEEHTSEL